MSLTHAPESMHVEHPRVTLPSTRSTDANGHAAGCAVRDDAAHGWFPGLSRGGLAVVVTLCALFLVGALFPLHHTDLWGHLAYGRWIVETGALPSNDPYGATPAAQTPLVDLWWLSQVALYGWYQASGLEGLSFAHGMLLAVLGGGVICAVRQRGASLGWSAVAALTSVAVALPALGALRPQLLAAAMFPWVFVAVDTLPRVRHPLVWLPILFAIWSNVHGSFPIGLVVLAVIALGTALETYRVTRDAKQTVRSAVVWRLALLLALAAAATLVNPYGGSEVASAVAFARNPILADISEWQPLRPLSIGGVTFAATLVIAVVVLGWERRRVRWHEIALLGVLALATISAQRMLVWWAVTWTWTTVPPLARLVALRSRGLRRWREDDSHFATRQCTVLAMLVVFLTLIWAPPTYAVLSGSARGLGRAVSNETPIHLADALGELEVSGPMFAPVEWGDYLVWCRDAVRPLVYSHVHLLEPAVWGAYLKIASAEPDWLALVERYDLRYLAVDRRDQFKLYVAAVHEPRCRIVYQDQACVLFEVVPSKETPR